MPCSHENGCWELRVGCARLIELTGSPGAARGILMRATPRVLRRASVMLLCCRPPARTASALKSNTSHPPLLFAPRPPAPRPPVQEVGQAALLVGMLALGAVLPAAADSAGGGGDDARADAVMARCFGRPTRSSGTCVVGTNNLDEEVRRGSVLSPNSPICSTV